MVSGKIYDAMDDALTQERARAHELSKLYNDTLETEQERREEILSELIPRRGERVYLQGPIYFDYGTNTEFGDGSYANFNLTVLDVCPVKIGKNVFIGPNVSFYTPLHPMWPEDRAPYYNEENNGWSDREYGAPITVEDDCWIGGSVTVCAGVTIGRGSVIGAGSVVTRDVPEMSLAFGNPCRVHRGVTEKDKLENHPELIEK